jgi:hypothetical protein
MINRAVQGDQCAQCWSAAHPDDHRQDEHDGDTMSTNGTLFVFIFNAALVFILNAGHQ